MPEQTTEEARTGSAQPTRHDDTEKALQWYIAMQILKAASLLTGLAIIGNELSKLRGG